MTDLPTGAYEHIVTHGLRQSLDRLDPDLVERAPLDPADSDEVLARHIAALARQALRAVSGQGVERVAGQVRLANRIAEAISAGGSRGAPVPGDLVAESHDLLTSIVTRPPAPQRVAFPARPETPLAASALLVNGRRQPRVGSEVVREWPPPTKSTCCARSSEAAARSAVAPRCTRTPVKSTQSRARMPARTPGSNASPDSAPLSTADAARLPAYR